MLQRIHANFHPQVIASLKWLAFSILPLTIDQLAEIFVLPSTFSDGFDKMSRLFSSLDVVKYFPGLIITEERYIWDITTKSDMVFKEQNRTILCVRLAHFSIKEYLTSARILQSPASMFAFTEIDAHMHIGRWSLAYHLHISSTTEIWDRIEYTLRAYASRNWAEHIEVIPQASWPPEVLRDAFLSLSVRSRSLLNMIETNASQSIWIRQPYIYTASRGFHQLTEILISRGTGINKYITQDELNMGLCFSILYRRKTIVELFLEKGAQMDNCLEIAAKRGDATIVGLLLNHGAKTNALAGELESALRATLWDGHLDILKILLSRGADINCPFNKKDCMTHLTLMSSTPNPVDCLRFLFDSGAGINMEENQSLAAALYVAIHLKKYEASRLLLDRGANLNELAGQLGFPLQAAICHQDHIRVDFEFIKVLLDHGADPNAQGGTYNTAFQATCAEMRSNNYVDMIKVIRLLFDRGADVSIQGGKYGTALQAACYNSNVPIAVIKDLLKNGADVNAQGGLFGNALQAACQRSFLYGDNEVQKRALEVVQLLLDREANADAQGGYYGTALQAACARKNEEVVRLLIDRGVNVNAQGGRYGTALQTACATGNLDIVHILLKEGANVNIEAGYHGTALEAACARGHTEVARVLLGHGANVHMGNNGALCAAALSREDDLVALLLDHGADVNTSHGSHGSPLHALLQREGNINKRQAEKDVGLLDSYEELRRYNPDWAKRVQLLLKLGADPNLVAGEYGTALQAACAVGGFSLYDEERDMYYGAAGPKLLLELCPNINVNIPGGLFGSALQAAAYSGQTPTISLLISRGAHVNSRGGEYGSALNAAIIACNWDIVQILLDAGATPDCHILPEPDEEWLQRVLEGDGQGGVERYRKFWEVEKAEREVSAD